MAKARKASGLDSPRKACPFSGKPIQFVETSAGWQARAPGWVSTTFYQTKEQAEWDFSFESGQEPSYKPFWKRVSVGEEVEEPLTDPEKRIRSAEKMMENIASFAEKELTKRG